MFRKNNITIQGGRVVPQNANQKMHQDLIHRLVSFLWNNSSSLNCPYCFFCAQSLRVWFSKPRKHHHFSLISQLSRQNFAPAAPKAWFSLIFVDESRILAASERKFCLRRQGGGPRPPHTPTIQDRASPASTPL